MSIRFYLFIAVIFMSNIAFSQQKDSISHIHLSDFWQRNYSGHVSGQINKEKQDAWVKQKIAWMQDSLDFNTLEYVEPNIIDIPDLQKVSYKLTACKNIKSGDKKSTTICVHSTHENPEIGDVCIGMTDGNVVYINYGHVCGGLINFERMTLLLPVDAFDFFSEYVSDTDGQKWVRHHF